MPTIPTGSSLVGRPEHVEEGTSSAAVDALAPPAASANTVGAWDGNQAEPFSASNLHHLVDVGVEAAQHTFSAASLAAQHAWGLIAGEQKKAPALQMPELELTGDASLVDRRELKQGMTGADVTQAQKALTEAGFPVPAIGRFGPKSEAAVLGFQKAHPPLAQTGKVDPETWHALREAAPKSFAAPVADVVTAPVATAPDGTPKLNQADPRWKPELLGNSSTTTIGQAGCLLTSVAMELSQKLGRVVDPSELNAVLVKGGGFSAKGANLLPAVAAKTIEAEYGVKLPIANRASNAATAPTGADLARAVDAALASGGQPILHVDADHSGHLDHFVLVNRKEGDDYLILDPANGGEFRYALDAAGEFKAKDSYFHGHAPVAGDVLF